MKDVNNQIGSWYDIYCIPDAQFPADCPIMDVVFAPAGDPIPASLQPATRVSFSASLDLIYTKQASAKAPLSFNKVG